MAAYQRVYVGQIPQEATREELKGMFEQCGETTEFYYKESSDHAYIVFKDNEGKYGDMIGASQAIRRLNGSEVKGKRILVEYSSKDLNRNKSPNLQDRSRSRVVVCFNCGKNGHVKRDCSASARSRRRSQSSSSGSSRSSHSGHSSSYSSRSKRSSSDSERSWRKPGRNDRRQHHHHNKDKNNRRRR